MMLGAAAENRDGPTPGIPMADGKFTITTDAAVLANNTDEGPTDEGGMQVLRWEIGPKTFGPPMALFKLAN